MKLLYVTDLHGFTWKYDRIFELAKGMKADVVINGGDMLPKSGDLFRQGNFITDYLTEYFRKFEQQKIFYLCFLGNDDLAIFDKLFDDTCRQYAYIVNLAQKKHIIREFEFIGMNYVVDYPFRLKDRCLRDTENYVIGRQFGSALVSCADGWKEIRDWSSYVNALPTLEEEIRRLPVPADPLRSVYVMHMPPSRLGLDVCYSGEKVGSEAIHNFLADRQPLLGLHGHIHESPDMSGHWKATLKNTLCVQPGQPDRELAYVEIDLPDMRINRRVVPQTAFG